MLSDRTTSDGLPKFVAKKVTPEIQCLAEFNVECSISAICKVDCKLGPVERTGKFGRECTGSRLGTNDASPWCAQVAVFCAVSDVLHDLQCGALARDVAVELPEFCVCCLERLRFGVHLIGNMPAQDRGGYSLARRQAIREIIAELILHRSEKFGGSMYLKAVHNSYARSDNGRFLRHRPKRSERRLNYHKLYQGQPALTKLEGVPKASA